MKFISKPNRGPGIDLPVGTKIESFGDGLICHVKITLPDGRTSEASGADYVSARREAKAALESKLGE